MTVKMPSSPFLMSSTFSPVETLKSARLRIMSQKASRFSFESCSFLNLPYMGNSTGLVITSFCRGYLATVPPISSRSMREIVELVLDRAQGGADARRTCPDHQKIVDTRDRAESLHSP